MLAIDYGADGAVVIAGRLDAAQCPAAQAFLDQVQGPVTLDCSRLEYISSAGPGRAAQDPEAADGLGRASCGSPA